MALREKSSMIFSASSLTNLLREGSCALAFAPGL
jgi:hypothetical protein